MSFVLTALVFSSFLFFTIILFPFDKMKKFSHAHAFLWSDLLIALNPYWNIEISGLKNIDKNKAYVVVANHQSLTDIILLYQTKMQFKWLANWSIFNVPFIGWSLTLTKHIKLKKGSLDSIKNAYQESATWLKRNMSIMLFPEGTRSNGNRMGGFQNGAFKIAIKEQVPILPISIKGTSEVLPKGGWLFTANMPISMEVLEPVHTSGTTLEDLDRLRDLVRSKIEAA
jgi:1-acyl-sn-glycerol-3-phosphate acyltransferase